ncbi:MAG TPA: acetolactate synthase large subunit [Gammaproteobacteria bacterium]|nr:acetolactate synthase large subunit [Gammaproteobacteria bacterium]
METLTGAEIVVRLLERQGVRIVAGIPGGAILPIYDALLLSDGLRHVLARHEQGAGFIAQGIARATGRPGVCLTSSGPGATNLLTALADAKLDSVPLIAITGQVPRGLIGTDAFQEVDTLGLSMPVTKHNFLVQSAAQLLDVLPRAFRIASSGRPGPVLIDIPKDVQTELAYVERWPSPGGRDTPPAPDDDALTQAAAMIDEAERPILYLGGGIIKSGAASSALALAEKISAPAVMTLMALGAMPAGHPLSLGMLGMHGARCTNLALDECDLLIAAGARFDDRATGRVEQFCPEAKIIHIDIDPAELGKIKAAHVGIVSDADAALQALTARLPPRRKAGWLERIAALKKLYPLDTARHEELSHPYGLVAAVARCLDDSAIVATDVGQHQMWTAQAYPLRRPRQWLTSGGLGTMGFGLPAAIGAALAEPERTVVCFSGDGSLLMNVQELATAAEEQVGVKIVLMNNRALGLVHQQQSLFYGGRSIAARFRANPDFVKLAAAFGVPGIDLDSASDPRRALAAALAAPGPCLIHVSVDTEEKVFPMVPPGAANRAAIDA